MCFVFPNVCMYPNSTIEIKTENHNIIEMPRVTEQFYYIQSRCKKMTKILVLCVVCLTCTAFRGVCVEEYQNNVSSDMI
jgi:sulfur relay (sulfurtransferase) complex TusBCD TusD component (DsrE family)